MLRNPRVVARAVGDHLCSLVREDPWSGCSSVFDGEESPRIPIRAYVNRMFVRGPVNPGLHILAVILVSRVCREGVRVTSKNVHRMYLAAFLVAVKVYSDSMISNADIARVGGVSLVEMNRLEIELLKVLDFDVFVVKEFDEYMQSQSLLESRCLESYSSGQPSLPQVSTI